MLCFVILSDTYSVCRLAPATELPSWAIGTFVSITRTSDELSVVCPTAYVPTSIVQVPEWRCLKIQGPLDLDLIGILSEITTLLAEAKVNVLAVGTYDTDYLFIKQDRLDVAVAALKSAGHEVRRAT